MRQPKDLRSLAIAPLGSGATLTCYSYLQPNPLGRAGERRSSYASDSDKEIGGEGKFYFFKLTLKVLINMLPLLRPLLTQPSLAQPYHLRSK